MSTTVTQSGSGAATVAITVSRGPAGAAGPNTVSTSTATDITGLIKGTGTAISAAIPGTDFVATDDSRLSDARTPTAHTHVSVDITDATSAATPNTIVKRGASGDAIFGDAGNDFAGAGIQGYSFEGTGIYGFSTSGPGIYGESDSSVGGYGISISGLGIYGVSNSNFGVYGSSNSNAGILGNSSTGANHAQFGVSEDNRSFIRRVLGLIGWHRGSYTQTLGSPATLSADHAVTLPNASGTVALTSDITGTNSGTNTGDETAARIATIITGASAKTTLVDADVITLTDSEASHALKKSALTNLWTWIVAKIGAITSITAGGAWSFSSTTRPTSAGTGTPASTSLITLADHSDEFFRKVTKYSEHEIYNFTTAQLTAIGGSASSNSTTGGVDLPAWSYRPSNVVDAAANYQALLGTYLQLSNGSNRAIKNWSKRTSISLRTYHITSGGTIRYYWGPQASTWAGGALAVRGIGFEIVNNQVFATCHNGTTKTTSLTGVTLTNQIFVSLHIESDGAGGVRWWVDGAEQTALTGGPTGNSAISQYGFCTEAINPTPAAATFVNIHYLRLASAN
jgi:hypothetical protein